MHWLKRLFYLGFIGGIAGVLVVIGVLVYFSRQVPDFRTLADYRPQLVTKVYTRNGDLLAEYARERRVYMPIKQIPKPVVDAFLAAEDVEFYTHPGFDIRGIIRAVLVNTFTSKKQGASTITQQVAKTFLLSSERTYTRKIKELILAWRIENAFTKDEILELYLNQIYLGNGAYGVGAAALAYYDKTLEELDIGQRAMLAGLPKAPSAYNPVRHPRVARLRRDVIIKRMEAEKMITAEEAQKAIDGDIKLSRRALKRPDEAPHFSEHVRRYLEERYGSDELYTGGMAVHTTLDPLLQAYAEDAVYKGLREYDRRHGYRGPIGRINLFLGWQRRLEAEQKKWAHLQQIGKPAVVLEVYDEQKVVQIGLPGELEGFIPLKAATWARKQLTNNELGSKIKKVSDVFMKGDIVLVKPLAQVPEFDGKQEASNLYSLEQQPQVQGSLVALDVRTGAIRAMVGGLGDGQGFNRAVQGKRQVGSAFKPFVYALALQEGYTPASIILDAPVVLRSGEMNEAWKPHNYSEKVYGPSTLRRGLEKSRNLMTIRLARDLGIRNIIDFVRRFGMTAHMEPDLSTALGSSSISLLELTSAYSVFANQGKWVEPYFIDRIQDMTGSTVYSEFPSCNACVPPWGQPYKQPPPAEQPDAWEVISPALAYQTADILKGVVQRGTGWRAKAVSREVGAKTGTTNDFIDAWFMGFSPDIATGVWVGFDQPRDMGKSESGSKAAGPIWTYFMKDALKAKPNRTFPIPEGVTFVRVDDETGALPTVNTKKSILEVFTEGSEPRAETTQRPAIKRGPEPAPQENVIEYQGIY